MTTAFKRTNGESVFSAKSVKVTFFSSLTEFLLVDYLPHLAGAECLPGLTDFATAGGSLLQSFSQTEN